MKTKEEIEKYIESKNNKNLNRIIKPDERITMLFLIPEIIIKKL
jgi:transcription antitermination factor NusG